MKEPKHSVLFACVENAGRSQMAEAFAHKYGLKACSAGTVPAPKVNPTVVRTMQEEGIDISRNKPKMLTNEMIEEADLVVTNGMLGRSGLPRPVLAKMQKKLIDWNLEDPRGKSLGEVRKIRDEIKARVRALSDRHRCLQNVQVELPPIRQLHRAANVVP